MEKCSVTQCPKCLMIVDWTTEARNPGVNLINVLRTGFARDDPKSAKRLTTSLSFLRFQDLHVKKMLVKCWWNLLQVSILPTFCEQLLRTQILKVQKKQSSCQSFFALLGSAHIKTLSKHVGGIDPLSLQHDKTF